MSYAHNKRKKNNRKKPHTKLPFKPSWIPDDRIVYGLPGTRYRKGGDRNVR